MEGGLDFGSRTSGWGVGLEGPLPLCEGVIAVRLTARVGILTSAKPNKIQDYGKYKN